MLIERGQLSFVFLDPVFGKEIGGYKTRPVVVISINDISAKQLPVLVVPGGAIAPVPRISGDSRRFSSSERRQSLPQPLNDH